MKTDIFAPFHENRLKRLKSFIQSCRQVNENSVKMLLFDPETEQYIVYFRATKQLIVSIPNLDTAKEYFNDE